MSAPTSICMSICMLVTICFRPTSFQRHASRGVGRKVDPMVPGYGSLTRNFYKPITTPFQATFKKGPIVQSPLKKRVHTRGLEDIPKPQTTPNTA